MSSSSAVSHPGTPAPRPSHSRSLPLCIEGGREVGAFVVVVVVDEVELVVGALGSEEVVVMVDVVEEGLFASPGPPSVGSQTSRYFGRQF